MIIKCYQISNNQQSQIRLKVLQNLKMENRLRQSAQISSNLYFKNPLKDTFQLNRNVSMMRSTISTSKSKDINQRGSLDKVKIKTLPHHALTKLDQNPNFMIIFQAIQIQRLSDQIETQRRKLRDLERQVVNASNYQVQIKQLSDQCTTLQEEIVEYQDELGKMNKICQKIYHQNDALKQKSKSCQKQLNQLKLSSKQSQTSHQQLEIVQPQQRKSNLKKTSQIITKQIQTNEAPKFDQNNFRKLLEQSQQNLRLVNEKIFSIDKRQTDITQYQLMIQGLSKQIQGAMIENKKLHSALKETSTEADKWQKAAMSTSNGNNTFYIFQKQTNEKLKNFSPSTKEQLSQKAKIDILSKQLLRLTQLILSKNNALLNLQENIFNLNHQNHKMKEYINNNPLNGLASQNIKNLQEQLESLKAQNRLYHEKIKEKTSECNNMRRNQTAIFKDLEQINKVRVICENQQNSIMEYLKDLENLKISNKNYEKLLAAEQLKNSQISLRLQQYLKRSNISKSNYFVQSTCVNTNEFPFIKNPQKQSLQIVFARIKQLQNTVKYLKQNYTNLLSRTGELDNESFPIKLGQSYEY